MTATFYEWYGGLAPVLQVFWAIALVTTLVFSIQMILTFIGIGDADMDVDMADGADFSDGSTLDMGGTMQLFTVRNMVNFFLGLGWGGVCLASVIPNAFLLVIAAVAVGVLFVVAFLIVYRQLFRLESNGAYHLDDCVGRTVDVYLTIPAGRDGCGKVQVSFNGSVQELSAMTDSSLPIPSGAKVHVVEIIDGATVLVDNA